MRYATDSTTFASAAEFARAVCQRLAENYGIEYSQARVEDIYQAVAGVVRDRLACSWMENNQRLVKGSTKAVGYLSAEYLLGKQLSNALLNVGLTSQFENAMQLLGFDPSEVLEAEHEPGLGNGGLGRLAACYIDSLSSLDVPAFGYGIRYRYGIFEQSFDKDGRQVEGPDYWLSQGDAWGHENPIRAQKISFGGSVVTEGSCRVWKPEWSVRAVPFDYPVPGYASGRVNTLRLWQAQSYDEFDLTAFNKADYLGAVKPGLKAETLSKVLYPEDSTTTGKLLRLEQQYFFVAASIADAISTFYPNENRPDLTGFPEKICFQLNDTHPVIGIVELMRILLDDYSYGWNQAWKITQAVFNYTCHTLLPEALEEWPVDLISQLLPRHMEIIKEIDRRFIADLRTKGIEDEQINRMRIVTTGDKSRVRMAYLATVGGQKVNGVAKLHSQLLKDMTLKDFYSVYPHKFTNVTNGVTPRRFIRLANPRLSALITDGLGSDEWISDLEKLRGLEQLADDSSFVDQFIQVKNENKVDFADYAARHYGFRPDPLTMFDVMVKRMHEYKRQSLKILSVIAQYSAIKRGLVDPNTVQPRTVIFGAKAAPGYDMAKLTIQLINNVARVVNSDQEVRGLIRVFFPWNYNVDLAEHVIPATDLDEQISQAGKEASGTSNMKFALNGAITVGTLDGANVEIRQQVGEDNFFLFGLDVSQVQDLYLRGYVPRRYYEADPRLKNAVDMVASGVFSQGDTSIYQDLVQDWLNKDYFMTMADFSAYMDIQEDIEAVYKDRKKWAHKAIINIARCGVFSSDRAVEEYLHKIWLTGPQG